MMLVQPSHAASSARSLAPRSQLPPEDMLPAYGYTPIATPGFTGPEKHVGRIGERDGND
jgi:hypothetical protein